MAPATSSASSTRSASSRASTPIAVQNCVPLISERPSFSRTSSLLIPSLSTTVPAAWYLTLELDVSLTHECERDVR